MTAQRRPSAVTMACLFVGLSCLLLLVNVVTWLNNWGSLELQEQLHGVLSSASLRDTGLTIDELAVWVRRVLLVLVVVLIAGIVFAVYASRGHRPSRIYLTVMCGIAGMMFVGIGGLIGLLPAALAIACAIQLWSPDARAWFDVKSGRTPAAASRTERPDPFAPSAQPTGTGQAQAGSTLIAASGAQPTPYAPPLGQVKRPASMTSAAVITLVGSAVVAGFCALALLAFAIVGDDYENTLNEQKFTRDLIRDSGVDVSTLMTMSIIMSAICLVLAVVGLGAALAVLGGRPIGRVALFVMAIVTLVVSLIGFPVGIPWTVASIIVLVQLNKPESRAWLAPS